MLYIVNACTASLAAGAGFNNECAGLVADAIGYNADSNPLAGTVCVFLRFFQVVFHNFVLVAVITCDLTAVDNATVGTSTFGNTTTISCIPQVSGTKRKRNAILPGWRFFITDDVAWVPVRLDGNLSFYCIGYCYNLEEVFKYLFVSVQFEVKVQQRAAGWSKLVFVDSHGTSITLSAKSGWRGKFNGVLKTEPWCFDYAAAGHFSKLNSNRVVATEKCLSALIENTKGDRASTTVCLMQQGALSPCTAVPASATAKENDDTSGLLKIKDHVDSPGSKRGSLLKAVAKPPVSAAPKKKNANSLPATKRQTQAMTEPSPVSTSSDEATDSETETDNNLREQLNAAKLESSGLRKEMARIKKGFAAAVLVSKKSFDTELALQKRESSAAKKGAATQMAVVKKEHATELQVMKKLCAAELSAAALKASADQVAAESQAKAVQERATADRQAADSSAAEAIKYGTAHAEVLRQLAEAEQKRAQAEQKQAQAGQQLVDAQAEAREWRAQASAFHTILPQLLHRPAAAPTPAAAPPPVAGPAQNQEGYMRIADFLLLHNSLRRTD
jgi:hypothetical protein